MWTLVSRPTDQSVVGTRWVFKNKLNADGKIVRNKDRLITKRYIQKFGIDFEESFTPVAILEAVRLLLAFVASRKLNCIKLM